MIRCSPQLGWLSLVLATMAVASPDAGGGLPRGWFVGGTDPTSYSVEAKAGQCSARAAVLESRPTVKPQGSVTVMQLFRAEKYRGQRVRFSGTVATKDVAGWSGLFLRVDGPEKRTLAFDNMQQRPLKGTTSCSTQAVVVDVAPTAEFIALGILLDGEGSAELSNIALEPVKVEDVPSTSLVNAPVVLASTKDPREDDAIGRVGYAWFGEKTVGGYLNEVGPGLWRWKGESRITYDGKTMQVEQGLVLPALGAEAQVEPYHGTFTMRREGASTVIEGMWGTALHSYPVLIRYSRATIDMKWGFYERHLVQAKSPQLQKGCVYFANQTPGAMHYNDELNVCGAVFDEAPPPVQTMMAFLWTGFRRSLLVKPDAPGPMPSAKDFPRPMIPGP